MAAFWTESRRELQEWFKRNAPSLGDLYEGALRMVFDQAFPGRTRFVAHAVREIRNRLPDVITGTTRKRFDEVSAIDSLASKWQKAGFSVDGTCHVSLGQTEDLPSKHVPLPVGLFRDIARVLREHLEARERPSEAAARLFLGVEPRNSDSRDSLRPVIEHWLAVTRWFVGKVHESGSQDSGADEVEFQRHFTLFETTLCALIRGFYKTADELDQILEDTNA